jgi:hypothetical protein
MSITTPVERRARTLVTLAVLMAAAVPFVAGPSAAARPAAPARVVDPTSRIATLSALVARRAGAVDAAIARRDSVRSRLVTVREREAAARARTNQLGALEAEAADRFEKSRARVARFAAAAYRDGPSVTPLTHLLSSDSAGDFAYRHEIVRRVGVQQRRLIKTAKRDRVAAAAAADAARDERNRLLELAQSLERELPDREAAATAAAAARDRAQFWLARWESIAAGPGTAIIGPPLLGADELARWFTATRHRARTTVPIDELAVFYIEEGSAAKVRSDIAFAQSMLETGGFSYPAGGQVRGTDNNFAGMGACDSCNGGDRFPDARTGVRAQMQQLRVYADPGLTNAALNPPVVNPKLDRHHLKGTVPTWAGLTGTWATARTYGDRILAIYGEILAWLTDRARI